MIRQHSREQVMGDLRMKRLMEWTFEGGPKLYFRRVGADGNRTRYQSGVYVCT